jgi:hypothetical protein
VASFRRRITQILPNRLCYKASAEAIDQWGQEKLRQADGKPIAIVFENEKVILFPINPKQFSNYRESLQNAGGKTDKSDARLLARLRVTGRVLAVS